MAETPPPPSAPTVSDNTDPLRYWCYHCEKRVSVETLSDDRPDLICLDCKNGFVESISAPSPSSSSSSSSPPPPLQSPSFNHQFLQILRLVARAARDESPSAAAAAAAAAPPPDAVPDPSSDTEDFLRIEFDGWGNDADDDPAAADEDDDDDEFIDELTQSVTEIEDEEAEIEEEEDSDRDRQRQRRRDLLRLRIRNFTDHGSHARSLDLDWAEIIRGLEDHTIELRVEMPDGGSDGYVGNPEDYVDAAGYEVLLQNLAENDGGSRRGAPPAARSVIAVLPTVEIDGEVLICAICKDGVSAGKKLPCEHVYHADCIMPWLDSRNSCPVCRFELPTDDPEYEEERKKRSDLNGNNVF